MKQHVDFVCPICGFKEYRAVTSDDVVDDIETSAEGHVLEVKVSDLNLGYECVQCTVMFGDPHLFGGGARDKQQPDQVVKPAAMGG